MLAQENDKSSFGWFSLVAAALLLLSSPLALAAERDTSPADSILSGPAPGPCAGQGADYVDGVDATGNAVVPAEGLGARPNLGDGTVVMTVRRPHGRDVSVPVHLADLTPPACTPRAPSR